MQPYRYHVPISPSATSDATARAVAALAAAAWQPAADLCARRAAHDDACRVLNGDIDYNSPHGRAVLADIHRALGAVIADLDDHARAGARRTIAERAAILAGDTP